METGKHLQAQNIMYYKIKSNLLSATYLDFLFLLLFVATTFFNLHMIFTNVLRQAVPKGNIFYCPSFPRLLLSSSPQLISLEF